MNMNFDKQIQFDPRTGISKIETPEDFDDVFYATHGLGDNPVTEQVEAIRHMIDPNEPTLQEVRFVKQLIKGTNPLEAYRKVFEMPVERMSNKAVHSAIARLLQRPRVARKMYELREMLMEMEEVDLMDIVHDLNEDRQLARDLGQPSAAIQATKVKATLLGLSKENKTTQNITVNLSDSQKKQLLSRIGNRILDEVDPAIEDVDFEEL